MAQPPEHGASHDHDEHPEHLSPAGIPAALELLEVETDKLLNTVATLTDADLAQPSLCPGWTKGHVVTHLAVSYTHLDVYKRQLKHLEELADVLEVQARRGLVEHVDGAAGGSLPQLGGQLDALRLAAGQRGRALPEPDIAEPHVGQRAHVPGDGGHRREKVDGLLDRHVEDVGDRLALEVHLEGLPVCLLYTSRCV